MVLHQPGRKHWSRGVPVNPHDTVSGHPCDFPKQSREREPFIFGSILRRRRLGNLPVAHTSQVPGEEASPRVPGSQHSMSTGQSQ